MPPKGIPEEILLDDVHLAAEQRLKLVFHFFEIVEAPSGIPRKHHEHVNIAVRPEVISEDGAEE